MAKPTTIKIRLNSTGGTGHFYVTKKNARTMMASAFSKLDLVTREEFDVQQEVLARTREKLEALEVRLAAVEALVLPPVAVAPEAVAEPVTETAPAAAPTPEAPGA